MNPAVDGIEKRLPDLAARLGSMGRAAARRKLVRRNRWTQSRPAIDYLYGEVIRQARINIRVAKNLALAIEAISQEFPDDYLKAQSLRARGHILYAQARYPDAISNYEAAVGLLRRLHQEDELGRTLSTAIHALIYLGRYDQALEWAAEARRIFETRNDSLRLARLDTNVGNLFYRQDRLTEALELYQKAYEEFSREATPQDLGAALSNLAVCYTSLGRFDQALDAYARARDHCERHNMPVLVAEADYNVAYLHFLRGEYQRAITLYDQARATSNRLRDPYHAALCDMDEAELYLELNLLQEGSQLAQSAFLRFGRLHMRYERAKSLALRAIAASRAGRPRGALRLFAAARVLFSRERNSVWLALIDLYRAIVLFEAGDHSRSRRLCGAALRIFSASSLAAKAAVCELLLARLDLSSGRLDRARALAARAASSLDAIAVPALAWQAWFVLGQVLEAQGAYAPAREAYRSSHERLEGLRSRLRGHGLKIAFLKDKLEVYESLVWLALDGTGSAEGEEAAFGYIEHAKSRSLADLIASGGALIPAPDDMPGSVVRTVRELQQRLNFCERQIELHELASPGTLPASLESLRRESLECEDRLTALLRDAQVEDREFAVLQGAGTIGIGAIRSSLDPGTVLVEYYRARGVLLACILSRDRLRVFRLCPSEEARRRMLLLQFQLFKFRLGPEYAERFSALLLDAVNAHLRSLYDLLIAPLRAELDGASHIVFVPHDFLHYLPFPALYDGSRYLIDDFSMSCAPSAGIYHLCRTRRGQFENRSLVLGVADELAPQISEEVRTVASRLPGSDLYVNDEASELRLRQLGPNRRFIHIATHGFFRQDNPMLSSLRLGDSDLTLAGIYRLHLPTDLLTLSGCGTGLQSVVGGDELVGLVRGFLYAGAQSVMVSLWDVNDKSTAEYMEAFYSGLLDSGKAAAARSAMMAIRERYPHPYHWAPFALIGDPHLGSLAG